MPSQRYNSLYETYTWNVPEHFNFGVDVVDYWARAADGPALIWENEAGINATYSFSDISRLTNQLGNALRAAGIGKGDRVIVLMPRIPAWQIGMVALFKIGAVPIPCIEMLTASDLAFRVRDSGARGVLCRAAQVPKFDGSLDGVVARFAIGGAPGWLDFEAEIASASAELTPAQVAAEDPAAMYYTSGSTGYPKGVLHSARGLYAWRNSAKYWLDLAPGDRIWCTADTGWSKAGTSILIGPWSQGACVLSYDGPYAPAERLRLLAKHRITVYCAAATELFKVLNEPIDSYDLSALRRTVSAGEAVNPVIGARWEQATGMQIAEAYGQTETLMVVLNIPGAPIRYGSMGLPAPGCEVDILDETGARCADGVEGVIALRAPNPQLMLGYWQNPARSQACYIDGPEGAKWFLTGDRASRDADGYFWFAGRDDDLIKSSGYRIGPMEVENVLLNHPAVQECAVVGVPDAERGEVVKAFVVLREGFDGSDKLIAELQTHAKAKTAAYKYPRAIEFIAEMPLTPTGKIRRKDLRTRG